MYLKTLISALLIAISFSAVAASPRLDARQQRQELRIERGHANGQLTHREAARLERQQARIARAEWRAKSDGHFGAVERRHLQHRQNHASAAIHRERHDGQFR